MSKTPFRSRLTNIGLLGATALFFWLFQRQTRGGFADPDAFYHARVSQLLPQGLISGHFPWLRYTTWYQHYADQHYLYHWLLVPFHNLASLHWSIIIFSTAMVAVFVWLLRQWQVRWPWLWAGLLLVSSNDFLFRINVVKANTLSLILLFLCLWLLQRRQNLWLFLASAIFVWTYGGFVFLPLIVLLYVICSYGRDWQAALKPLLACAFGIGVGIILHPHFPNILSQLYNQIFQAGLGIGRGVIVGREWYPYDFFSFIQANGFAFIIWLGALAVFGSTRGSDHRARQSWWLGLVSVLFFFLTVKSRRFVEYWVPFALIFSAYVFNPYLRKLTWLQLRTALQGYWQVGAASLILFSTIAAGTYYNLNLEAGYMRSAQAPDTYKNAADWLNKHSQPGEIVFNTQWDQFPQLFYWDYKNYYIIGEDPTFMFVYSKDLYRKWRQVSNDDPSKWGSGQLQTIIKSDFHASYVFVENSRNPKLKTYLEQDPSSQFSLVYSDAKVSLYQVR